MFHGPPLVMDNNPGYNVGMKGRQGELSINEV